MRFWLLSGVFALAVSAYAAPKKQVEKRDAKELGRIAIVPFLDLSGERQEEKDEYRKTALSEVEERCLRYEIAFVPADELERAMAALKMSPKDEEDRTKSRLGELAKQVKARYVVTGTIHDAKSEIKQRGSLGDARKTGQAKVQFRVLDVEAGLWDENKELTATSTARAGAFSSNLFTRANKLRVKAVRDATKKAMAAFLEPYPKLHEDLPDKEK